MHTLWNALMAMYSCMLRDFPQSAVLRNATTTTDVGKFKEISIATGLDVGR